MMESKNYFAFSGILFSLVGLLHLIRAIYGWSFEINNFVVDIWVSWLAVVVLGFLAYNAFKLYKK